MKVLLSDGSGLTARQCATLLARAGHEVGVLAPGPLVLARATTAVRRWHRVPVFGLDPLAWADAALSVLDTGRYDVLLPTQEQVTVLSLIVDEITRRGVATAVPPFAALRRVQDKLSAEELLTEVGLPRPGAIVARTPDELLTAVPPVYVKAPIGTASTGVRHVTSEAQLRDAGRAMQALDAYELGGVLVQQPVPGPLLMVQAVFESGRLLAAHANTRDVAGAGGGASHKTSVAVDPVRPALELIGAELGWHGALSCDVIDGPDGPVIIDVNPRLVEPGNAAAAGLDLVAVLLDVATGRAPRPGPQARPGVRTYQLLLALAGAAQGARPRRALLRQLGAAAARTGDYRAGHEELSPLARDPLAMAALAALSAALLVAPVLHARLASSSVANYAITPSAWSRLTQAWDAPEPNRGRPHGHGRRAGR
ncbi:ATP-grasp domain-containing protein [Pseudonocardia sp. DSM 110487]|uniref:ATP-grasp domain-containing protein n=1 Tax=Pseudonocardia sp. DSM 110487 TaxID=2865833 RepID=UPI001C6A4FDE|nr:ATP-grasp domain-containing protein [Pseudonocardia sp. DSM 110487]QYN38281.1 ATP-grasp domain-containing protein [Pseudonocardia sp. DSM 110487]